MWGETFVASVCAVDEIDSGGRLQLLQRMCPSKGDTHLKTEKRISPSNESINDNEPLLLLLLFWLMFLLLLALLPLAEFQESN